MRRPFILFCLLSLSASGLFGQQTVFKFVKIRRHRSAEKRVLVDKIGTLTFDDGAHRLRFESDAGDHIDVAYEDIEKVIFDVATHMRGGILPGVIGAAPVAGPMVGIALAGSHVNDYWLFLSYKGHEGSESTLFVAPKDSSALLIDKATALFSSRVTIADFPEKSAPVKMEDLKAVHSRQAVKIDRQSHPLPEVKADRATVLVVCPPLAARDEDKGNQFKLHANDEIIAVNKAGTYSFAYLLPGKYRLVSQSVDASGFEINLEAGHEYFFLQNIFQGVFKWETSLSRNSPEVVTYLAAGAHFSDWKPKE
jgi:hypothetical protein